MMSGCVKVKAENRIVYACAGCADVGEIADRVSRKLRRDGFASQKSSCLSGIGAGLQGFIDAAKAAESVVTIDGCSVACTKKMIENIGIHPCAIFLTDMGLVKGDSVVTPDLVDRLAQSIKNQF